MGMMNRFRDQALALNERVVEVANNAFDRIFIPGTLVQSGQTPHEVIHTYGITSVRYYPPLDEDQIELADGTKMFVQGETHGVPLVFVPPLAARPTIFDLMPNRSLVKYFVARGFRVYLIDWGEPGREQAHYGLGDYVNDLMPEALKRIREHAQVKELSLFGWCLGGLFCLMYAGISGDAQLRNIVTVASPIDTREGSIMGQLTAALMKPAELVRKFTNFRLHNLAPEKLTIPGWANSLVFKLTNPIGSITTYWDLILRLWDREFVESHTTTSNFLNNMLAYPGRLIQDMVVKFSIDNDLSKGRIELDGQTADFSRILSSVLIFAGATDTLVTPDAARKSLELVASEDKRYLVAPGGHVGVLAGAKAQAAVWMVVAEWLADRSKTEVTRAPESFEAERKIRRRKKLSDDPAF
ncbi:MAG: alpha/beta fold hydrolase [Panacagrimonas sp.]